MEKRTSLDALELKRRLSEQFSNRYTTEKGLIDREKLKRDLANFRPGFPSKNR